MGNKAAARQAAHAAGVPILEGSQGAAGSDDDLLTVAESIGYPLLIKAAAGGAGEASAWSNPPTDCWMR